MKKKILFMIINMNVGGTEKALLNMITQMPEDEYDITILMLEKSGGFLSSIPPGVHIEYLREYKKMKSVLNLAPRTVVAKCFKEGHIIKGFNLLFIYVLTKLTKDKTIFFKYILKGIPNFKFEYDIAVAYAGPMDFISYFVAHKIKSKRKIQWIHFDVTKIGFDSNFAARIYREFDKIFVVSNEGRTKISNLLPHLKDRIETLYNILPRKLIIKMADEKKGFEDYFEGYRILTVGRLSKEKGQDMIISVLAKLKEDNLNVKWYCIGDGSSRTEYENLIKAYGVEQDFILLGAKENPYPYMKSCDIYVQPSRHEGYCITLAEAKCFNIPIISTNFAGASEQLTNNHTGIVVNFDKQEMYDAIKKIIEDTKLRNSFKENLKLEYVDKIEEVEKLKYLFNSKINI